jgi:predicted NUDIX family phosphoesterase
MTTQTTQPHSTPVFAGKQDENILVVRRDTLFPEGAWTGLKSFSDTEWVEEIMAKKEFHPRSLMETDPTYKQIIPYLVFTCNGKWFIMQRRAKASETRLQSKWSLGIGGHIRQEDMEDASLLAWATREFEEEVEYKGNWTCKPVGILNDDSNDVGKVHAGFVYIVTGDSEEISIKDEHQSGHLWSFEECAKKYDSMETWSQIVFDWIKQQ